MQCFPIRGIFCHSCYFPNQLLSKNSCKRLRQSKETYKVLILVTPTMKLQDIWITPIWHKIRSNRLLWYKIFKPATKSFPLAIGEGMYFYFLLTMKAKSAPLLMGQNAYAEKGGLPHSSNGRLLELLELLFLSSQETFTPCGLQRGTPYLCKGARNMKGQGKWGRESGRTVIMRQEFTVEIVTMNHATVHPPGEKKVLRKNSARFLQINGWNIAGATSACICMIRSWRYELCTIQN